MYSLSKILLSSVFSAHSVQNNYVRVLVIDQTERSPLLLAEACRGTYQLSDAAVQPNNNKSCGFH